MVFFLRFFLGEYLRSLWQQQPRDTTGGQFKFTAAETDENFYSAVSKIGKLGSKREIVAASFTSREYCVLQNLHCLSDDSSQNQSYQGLDDDRLITISATAHCESLCLARGRSKVHWTIFYFVCNQTRQTVFHLALFKVCLG